MTYFVDLAKGGIMMLLDMSMLPSITSSSSKSYLASMVLATGIPDGTGAWRGNSCMVMFGLGEKTGV